ncbi:MAG TPA: phosphatase PAP2 family protein [Rhodothermales bacterium]|nr:phosphatase PAP2 family protein [Rhodothermales bacterium]
MDSDRLKEVEETARARSSLFVRFLRERFRKGGEYGLAFTLTFLAILAALWLFIALIEVITEHSTAYWLDTTVQGAVSAIRTPTRTAWAEFITDLGGTRGSVVGAVILGLILLFRRRWWALLGLVFATGVGGLVVLGLKAFFQRPRPLEQVIHAGGYSFPSGHAFAAMVFFGYVIYEAARHLKNKLWRAVVIVLSTLLIIGIGLSRVYLNVHYLTDVLGGFASGFVWLCAVIFIIRAVEKPLAPTDVP